MTRTLVISDIHGCHEKFVALLKKIKFNPESDQLILLGDYVDRGKHSKEVVEQVMRMVERGEAIALRGNHDQRFLELVMGNHTLHEAKFLEHGGVQTINSYCGTKYTLEDLQDTFTMEKSKTFIRKSYKEHILFLDKLRLYYEDTDHIFVHAGLNPFYYNWREQPEKDFIWIRDAFVKHPTIVEKTVVFGHTKTIDIHGSADIWFGGDKIGIDGGSAYGLQLNCLEIMKSEEGQVNYRCFFA